MSIQFGILALLGSIAFLLFSLPVGVYVDRHRRRSIMIYADLGRAGTLAIVPASYFLGFLSVNLLYVVAFVAGLLTVFFEISYQSYIPTLVDRDQIVDANGKLEATRAISSGVGPALAGFVVKLFTPSIAIIGDTIGYINSAGFLFWIKKTEGEISKTSSSTWKDIKEGLRVVLGDRRLWQIAACTSTANLFTGGVFAIIVPYLSNEFGYGALQFGLLLSTAAIGSVIGALISSRIASRIGVGPSIILNAFIFGPPSVGLYLTTGAFAPLLLISAFFVTGFGAVAYNVNQVSYRQALVPRYLLGRMNATMRFIVTGSIPIGGIIGGLLGEAFGYRTAIGLCVLGVSVAFVWVLFSPIRSVKKMPTPEEMTVSPSDRSTGPA